MLTVKGSFLSFTLVFIISISNTFSAPLDSVLLKTAASQKAIIFRQIEQSERESRFLQTDSLFRILDRAGVLNTGDFLRWAQTKELMEHYTAMAGLYCRVAGNDSRLGDIAFGQLRRALERAPVDSIASAMGVFQKCTFSVRGADTLRMAMWFADFYSRHGMDAEELRVLQVATASGTQLVPRLLDLAREQYVRGRFEKAVLPARIAFDRGRERGVKTAAARLMYQAFQSLHRNDSALVWLNRTEIANDNAREDAVTLYQSGGQLAEAEKNMALLGPSFSRDTLEIRQKLFSGDTKGAMGLVEKTIASSGWKEHPRESLLWKMRTLIFSGKTNELTALFDSQTVDPSWEGAREILNCRLIFQQLSRDPVALAGWSRLEYDLYTGRPASWAHLAGTAISEGSKTVLLLRLIKDFLAKDDDASALTIFKDEGNFSDAPEAPAEYRYLYAETLVRSGSITQAQEMLSGILEDFQGDIYSEKARVLLKKIQSR